MKAQITTAALVLATVSAFAQTSGVAHPDSTVITSTDDSTVNQTVPRPLAAKPSAAVATPVATPSPAPADAVVYGPYVPYKGATVASNAVSGADDPDAMIVTSVPEREGELREGTLLQTKIKETLSTNSTLRGSRFTAEVTAPIERKGRVIIPVGAILEGQVTEVHGGRRITGAAALHLETRDILLPDGTHYVVHAQLVDTGTGDFKINDEGTLKRKDHTKQELAVVGGVTGAGAVRVL